MDAVPVAHALPERFAATLWANDPNMGDTGWAAVQYVNGGEHEVVLSPLYVGNYTLSLKLDGVRVDIVRRVVVNCGKDRVAIDGGWACGCESGFEPNADAAGYDSKTSTALCVLCEKGKWSQPGAATCLLCPAFSTTAAQGSADITQCLVECGLQTLRLPELPAYQLVPRARCSAPRASIRVRPTGWCTVRATVCAVLRVHAAAECLPSHTFAMSQCLG